MTKYEVGKELGHGGFGRVYKAFDLESRAAVAIKKIGKARLNGLEMKKVYDEIGIHIQLSHVSIVKMLDCYETDYELCIVLEYCRHGDLENYMKQRCTISEPEGSTVIKQILDGLLYLQKHNIIHRDLKLANILLTADNFVKIADFGLSTKLSHASETHVTICGTPKYMAPEIRDAPHGREVDVWSLGVLLYRLLVGCVPFPSQNVKSSLQIPYSVSNEARDLISEMLIVNPVARISTMGVKQHKFLSLHPDTPLKPIDSGSKSSSSYHREGVKTRTSSQSGSITNGKLKNMPCIRSEAIDRDIDFKGNSCEYTGHQSTQDQMPERRDFYRKSNVSNNHSHGSIARDGDFKANNCEYKGHLSTQGHISQRRDSYRENQNIISNSHSHGSNFREGGKTVNSSQCNLETGSIANGKVSNIPLSQSRHDTDHQIPQYSENYRKNDQNIISNNSSNDNIVPSLSFLRSADMALERQFVASNRSGMCSTSRQKSSSIKQHNLHLSHDSWVTPREHGKAHASITTQRLLPVKTPYRDGIISIESTGEAVFEKRINCRESAFYVLLTDGYMTAFLSKNYEMKSENETLRRLYPNLPKDWIKYYKMIKKFIRRKQQRTIKINYYTDVASCQLMEAPGCFVVNFHSGEEVNKIDEIIHLKRPECTPEQYSFCEFRKMCQDKRIYNVFTEIYKKCLRLEELLESCQDTLYPVTFGTARYDCNKFGSDDR